jgi:hypothetical protein
MPTRWRTGQRRRRHDGHGRGLEGGEVGRAALAARLRGGGSPAHRRPRRPARGSDRTVPGYALRLASASEDDPGFAAHARLEAIWENPDLIAEVLFDLGHDNRVTKGGVVAAASRFIEDQRIFAATRRPPSVEAIAAKVESIKASLSKPMPLPPSDAEPPPRPHNETDREETTP